MEDGGSRVPYLQHRIHREREDGDTAGHTAARVPEPLASVPPADRALDERSGHRQALLGARAAVQVSGRRSDDRRSADE